MAHGAASRKRRQHRRRGLSKATPPALTAGATGSTSLPLSDRDTGWDGDAAWRSLEGSEQLGRACFWRDPDGDPETKTAYKLVFALNDGGLTAIWRGVTACAAVLQGARGGVDIPEGDVAAVRRKVESYYAKAREKYDDDTIQAPWEATIESAAMMAEKAGLVLVDEEAPPSEAVALAYAEAAGDLEAFTDRLCVWTNEFQVAGECSCGHMAEEHVDDGVGACTVAGCACEAFEQAVVASFVAEGTGEPAEFPDDPIGGVAGYAKVDDGLPDGSYEAALTPERAALRALELRYTTSCECRHPLSEHLGADGPCTHEDGRGQCSCGGYAEMGLDARDNPDRVTLLATSNPGGVLRCDVNSLNRLTPSNGVTVTFTFDTLDGVGFGDPLTADALAAPVEVLPARTPTAQPDIPDQPTAVTEKAWTATLTLEGVLTDDDRAFAPGSITWRELPLTLMTMFRTEEGHDGAVISGRIDRIWRDGQRIRAEGVFDSGEHGEEAARLVGDGTLRGVSVDTAVRKVEAGPKSDWFDEDGRWIAGEAPPPEEDAEEEVDLLDLLFGDENAIYVITDGVIGAATVCPFPAFADATISLIAGAPLLWRFTHQAGWTVTARPREDEQPPDGATALNLEGGTLTASAAGLAPLAPPASWFEDPQLEEATAVTVTDDGRIFGHLAPWGVCHIGLPGCRTAPASATGYRFFHLGEVTTFEGDRLPVGKITLDTGHADRELSAQPTIRHYDDTGTVAAYIRAGEDEHGIWIAGTIAGDLSEDKVTLLRGAVLSGDWRNIEGSLELVAALAVNVPGFPVPRTPSFLVAAGTSGEAEVLSLVAAGVHFVPRAADPPPEGEAQVFQALAARAWAEDFQRLAARASA